MQLRTSFIVDVGYVKARALLMNELQLKMLFSELFVFVVCFRFKVIAVQLYEKGYFCTVVRSFFHLYSVVDTSATLCALAHLCVLFSNGRFASYL